ncbi:hypothetical protein OIU78_014957 [Salix suchowensis]|nr:hypothetical protein OIU78_014957 [Salix suchowensis]
MSKERPPEPLDFFIWTVEDVGLWLEEINLGGYRQIFKDNGVNGEYLEGMSMFTTEQILRFIRRCHMKWGDFITLCKELRRIKGSPSVSKTLMCRVQTYTHFPHAHADMCSCILVAMSLKS